jgi:hypothetical protein
LSATCCRERDIDSSGTVRRQWQAGPMVVRGGVEPPTFRFSGL